MCDCAFLGPWTGAALLVQLRRIRRIAAAPALTVASKKSFCNFLFARGLCEVCLQRMLLLYPLRTCFFNESHKIVQVFINIIEKYKTTVMGDYRQEKEKNEKKRRYTRLDWNINTRNSTTQLSRGTPHFNSYPIGLGHQLG